jgi:uncharacterized damage-inducible protein DinB
MQLQPDQARFLFDILIPQLENEHKTTLKVLRAVPADQGDYRPDPVSMTAFELAWHIAGAEMMFLSGVAQGEFRGGGERPESIQNAQDVAEWYAGEFPKQLDAIRGATGEQLMKMIPFHMWTLPALQFLNIMHVHSIHHRGQLSAYLRPMGAKVPAIYGGSADEPMRDAATS